LQRLVTKYVQRKQREEQREHEVWFILQVWVFELLWVINICQWHNHGLFRIITFNPIHCLSLLYPLCFRNQLYFQLQMDRIWNKTHCIEPLCIIKWTWFDYWQGKDIFIFSRMSRLAVGACSASYPMAPEGWFSGGMKLTTHL
jgi:hypothetical protein